MITINCITCNKDDFKDFYSRVSPKNNKTINVVICKNCGTIQVRPRPDEKETLAYYTDKTYRVEKPVDNDAVHLKLLRRGERILTELKKHNYVISSVLEIGCGIGSILQPFKENGSKILGYELNAEEVEYGKAKGLNLIIGTIDDVPKGKKFDVIIYSHLIEHLVYPLKEIAKIYNILEDNGALVVLLPSFYNMKPSRYKMNNIIVYPHLQYFTLTTLTNLLAHGKFKCIYGEEEILSIFTKTEEKIVIKSDYTKARIKKVLYKIYSPFYIPFFRIKRKTKKILNIG